jgi:hypothetical protein
LNESREVFGSIVWSSDGGGCMNRDNVDELVNENSEDSVLRDEKENKR